MESIETTRAEAANGFALAWDNYRHQSAALHEEILFPQIVKYLGNIEDKLVLDVGCGRGDLIKHIQPCRPGQVIAIDVNSHLVATAHELDQKLVKPFVHDLSLGLPPEIQSCQAIVCANVLMHLNDADAVRLLKDFARVLQPGGKVIIVTTHPSWVEHNYTKKPVSGTVSLARNMGGATVQQFHRSAERMGDLFDRAKLGLFVRSQIPICSSASFSPRYRQNFGAPLYDLFVLGDARAESPTHENLKQRHVRQLLAEVWPPYAEESITLAGFRISLSSIESAQKATKLLPDSPPVQNPELILPSLDFTVVAYAGTVHMSFASEEGRSTTVDFPRGDRPDWAGHGKWRYNLTLKRFEIFRLPDAGNLPEEIFVVITRVLEESLSRKLKVIKMRLVK